MSVEKQHWYAAIDLKSFYASVECVERGLDPMTTHLVVADNRRTSKTICLAVTPALKAHGISGRARLFEVEQRVREVNAWRKLDAPRRTFVGSTTDATELEKYPEMSLDYIVTVPRMALYMDYSLKVIQCYLQFVASEDLHAYSVDEVFINLSPYLSMYQKKPQDLVATILKKVYETTGLTATAGIGTNLYLAKVSMDILAKHAPADAYGVRMATLDEISYRQILWSHEPITDFWRIGQGYAKKLKAHGMTTMGDVARCSIGSPQAFHNEALLYKMFGVQAELLIDHAWGWESTTIADIKAYEPDNHSLSRGQVLHEPYAADKARVVVREMIEDLVLHMVSKKLVCDQLVLTIGYDVDNLQDEVRRSRYQGAITIDYYGRAVPKHAHGTTNLPKHTHSLKLLSTALMMLYDRIINNELLIRRITISAQHLLTEEAYQAQQRQLTLFDVIEEQVDTQKEQQLQETILALKEKFGKNTILKGFNFEEGATGRQRNQQIGGHQA